MNGSNIIDQYKTIENIKFNHDCFTKLVGLKENKNSELISNTQDNFVLEKLNLIREVHVRNFQECSTNNGVISSSNDWNQKIFHILKVWTCKNDCQSEDYVSLGYKPHEYSFQEYIGNITKSIEKILNKNIDDNLPADKKEIQQIEVQKEVKRKQDEVLTLLHDIIDLVSFLHSREIVFKNIELNNIIVSKNDRHFKPKIVNLSSAEAVANDSKANYKIDLINIGKLFFSFLAYNDNYEKHFRDINSHIDYEQKHSCILKQIKNVNWIEPHKKQLFAHLIIYLLEVKDCDNSTISYFKTHPFFWDLSDIEEFIRITSCRIDYNDKVKYDHVIKSRIKEINEKHKKYDNWKELVDLTLHTYIQKTFENNECKCNELVKFIRNKIAHKDDDTDNEEYTTGQSDSKSSSPASKKVKLAADLKKLCEFFDERGGPLSYFLFKFPELLYDLYVYFRQYSSHKRVSRFYMKFFNEELPKAQKKILNPTTHSPTSPQSKNDILYHKVQMNMKMDSQKRK